MASPRTRYLRNALLAYGLLGLGLWMAGKALWQLGSTALYVHESVVVTGTVVDVRQKPFESWSETLGKGNWSMPGDVSYQPIVRFTLPGNIDAIRLDLEADNVDYDTGQEISIISPPTQPGKARINRWKFLWGAPCLQLLAGCLLSLCGHLLRRQLKRRQPAPTPAPSPARRSAKKTRQRQNTAGSSTAPRRRKKANKAPAETQAAPAKPRRSRKKKAESQQQELPF